MANEELNKNENNDSILGLESDSLDELGKISAEELEKFGSELKDFNDEPKPETEKAADEADKPVEKADEAADAEKTEAVKLADILDNKTDNSTEGKKGADGRPTGPNGQRRRRPNGQRRPRPDGQRPGPDGQRPRPNGKRPRPNGQRPRPNGADPALRRRPNPAGEKPEGEENTEGKKKGWTKKKKAVLITVVTIVLTLALIVAVILILFFSYTGKLNRDLDTRTNSGEYKYDSSELASKPDTMTKEDKEKKLKELQEMLAKRSKPISDSDVMNILFVGEDLRDTEPDPETGENPRGNTDVQLLVSINKKTKKIVLASFLRDQYLDIEGYGMGRLNVAYWKNGIPLLSDTISKYYNVHIDRYVLVNFYSFIDVVDEIGGLDLDVDNDEFAAINEAVREHNYYLKNPETKDYVKQPGKQHLNGNQALAYARIRQGCGDDYGRTERQRETITAIINKMKGMSLLDLSYLIDKVAPQITTDISDGEIASLLLSASEIMNYQICQVQMPTLPYFTEEIINQMAVLVPDYDKCCTVLLDMIYGDSKTAEDAIKKVDAGTINQYTYTQGGNQQTDLQQQPQDNVLQNDQQQQQQYY